MCEFRTPRYPAEGHDAWAAYWQPQQGHHGLALFNVIWRVAVMLAVVTAFGSNASAQVVAAPPLEIAGGYQLSQSFRALSLQEWFVSVARPLDDRVTLVGEVAGASLRKAGRGQTVLVGFRYAWSGRRVTPFVQGLVGGASLGRTFDRCCLEGDTVEVESLFGGYQVAAGIDVRITRRIAARFAANSLTLYSDRLKSYYGESGSTTRFRFTAGAVTRVPPLPDTQALHAPSVEIAGGYQGFTSLSRLPFPRGWFVSVGRPLNERVTVVGEVADAFFRDVTPTIFVDEEHWYTYLGGVRYAWPGQRVVPFVQALGGAGVVSSREETLYREPPTIWERSYRYVALQFTGGVDILIVRRISARFTASNLTLYEGAGGSSVLRFSTGVVIRLGSR